MKGTIFIAGLVLGSAFFIQWVATQRSTEIGNAITNAAVSAMRRGYQCHVDGRTFEDCEAEQRERWRRVDAGATSLPNFGER